MKRIVVLSDLQIPYHDSKAVKASIQFVKDYKPDELWCVGDELDAPEPSRWNKGMAGEYAGTLQDGIDLTRDIMSEYRKALGKKPFYIQRSNHTDRIDTYMRKYAPAFSRKIRNSSRMGAASSTRAMDRILVASQSPRPGPQTTPKTLRGPSGTSTKGRIK